MAVIGYAELNLGIMQYSWHLLTLVLIYLYNTRFLFLTPTCNFTWLSHRWDSVPININESQSTTTSNISDFANVQYSACQILS